MDVNEFAERHRLKTQRSHDDGTEVINGSLGHLYEYSDTELGVCFLPPGEPRPKKWGNVRRACIAAGMTLLQNGDSEGCLSFDPNNREQVRLASYQGSIGTSEAAPVSRADCDPREISFPARDTEEFRGLKPPPTLPDDVDHAPTPKRSRMTKFIFPKFLGVGKANARLTTSTESLSSRVTWQVGDRPSLVVNMSFHLAQERRTIITLVSTA